MNRSIASLVLLLLLASTPRLGSHAADAIPGTNQIHAVRGVVREVAPDCCKVVIRHEAITNYMPAMTMEFIVRDTNELNGVVAGDTITFFLKTTDDTHWISGIRKVAGTTNNPAPATRRIAANRPADLKSGDLLPDCELLAENGKHIRFLDFLGKAVAFTFIFTRCPLPDYCPRMGNNFAKAREWILARNGTTTNWQFLSISFYRLRQASSAGELCQLLSRG